MAQTGYTAIQLYYTTTVSATPTAGNLAAGELAINTADEKLYFKNSSGVVKLLASTLMVGTNGGTGVNNGSRTISYAGNIAFTGAFNPTFAIPSSSTYTFPTGDSTLVATTGTVANATAANGIKTATTTVSVSGSTAPTAGQVLVASSTTLAAWGVPTVALNSITAAGGSATIANGNNPITWNWTQTTSAQTAFSIGETSASTNGVGSQYLLSVATIASSTANPFRVQTRGATDSILVGRTGDVSVTGNNVTSGTAGSVTITAGSGTTTAIGGIVTIQGGGSTTTQSGNSGGVVITAGNATVDGGVTGGPIRITAGNGGVGGGAGSGGGVSITAGNSAGAGNGGDITLTTGTTVSGSNGKINFVNTNVANGAVATAMSSVGPTGANTAIQGWLAIKVGGTARYIPFW